MTVATEGGVIRRERTLHAGGVELHMRSTVPPGRAVARLGVVHGYGDHSGRYAHFVEWMVGRGVECHSFDFRGHGRASGKRGYVRRWDEYLEDLSAFLAQPELGGDCQTPLFLLGHSHGGLVLAAAAERGMLKGVRGVVLSAPYFRNCVPTPGHKLILSAIANRLIPWVQVPTGIRVEWLSRDESMCEERRCDGLALRAATPRWFETMRVAQREALASAQAFDLPLLMLVAGNDPIAEPTAQGEFYERASSKDKSRKVYPGMVHEILREKGREVAFGDVLGWMKERVRQP